jgi:hypothetical protein
MENRKYIYQKYENTTGVIRICNSRENRQYIYQKLEDTTEVTKARTENTFTKGLKIPPE